MEVDVVAAFGVAFAVAFALAAACLAADEASKGREACEIEENVMEGVEEEGAYGLVV